MKNRLFNLAKLVISIGLLALLFRLYDFRQSWAALKGMDWRYFALAFFCFEISQVVRAFRWKFLLDAVGVPVPVHRLTYLYYVGTFFNTFLPSGFGGDAIKMVELARYSKHTSESVSTVVVDRLAGIIMLFIMGLIALPFTYGALPPVERMFLLIASVGGLLASWLLFQRKLADVLLRFMPRKIRATLESLYNALHTCGVRALWKSLAVSALFNITLFSLNYFIALALDVHLPFAYFVAFMPILSLSMLIPSVGALGTREGAYVLLFGAAGVSQPVAIAMSLAFYVINVLTGLIGAVLYAVDAALSLRSKRAA